MSFIANLWFQFIVGLLRPFSKMKEDRMKLVAAIESDRETRQQRFMESILDSQKDLIKEVNVSVSESSTVIKDWLQGLQNMSNIKIQAPETQTDEVRWRREQAMNSLDSQEIEQYIREAVGKF